MTKFLKESELCTAFMNRVPDDWIVYPETGGFDIMLVRKADGLQIGIEAKLKLNAKVINQVAEDHGAWYADRPGPDCRAVLVPQEQSYGELASVCGLLGITVIGVPFDKEQSRSVYGSAVRFRPSLPKINEDHGYGYGWFEFHPAKRITLPEYIPDTLAGTPCPITLTSWKIAAIKMTILMDRTGYVTRKDFKDLKLSISRWIQGGLNAQLLPAETKGSYIKGKYFPDFSKEHPVNYKQISEDFEKWNPRKFIEL